MQATKLSIWAVPILAAGSIALSGCGKYSGKPTTISYHEVGICKSYDVPTGANRAKTDEGFAVFKIETVDNTKNGRVFTIEPERLYVDQSNAEQRARNVFSWNRHFVDPDPRFAKSMGVKGLESTSIPASQKLDIESFVLTPIGSNNPSGGPEANQFNLELVYDSGTRDKPENVNEGILLVKTNPPDSKYAVVEDCKDLALK